MPSYPAAPVANSLLASPSAAAAAATITTTTPTTTAASVLSGRDYKQVQARNQPRLLSQEVPACALPCLEAFISSDRAWDHCPDPLDANCLCKKRSTTGFTVAEAGLRCVAENCHDAEVEEHRVYNICSGIEGALPNTHPVLGISSTALPKPTMTPHPGPPMASTTPMAPAPPAPTPPAPAPPASESLPSMSMMMETPAQTVSSSQITSLPASSSTRGIPGVGLPTDTIDFSYVYSSPTETGSASGDAGGAGRSNLVGLYVGGGIAFASLVAFVLFFFFLNKRRQRAKQGRIAEKGQKGPYLKIDPAMAESRATPALSISKASSKPRSSVSRYQTLLPIDMMPCSVAYFQRNTRDFENEYLSSRGPSVVSQRTESDLLPDNPYCANTGAGGSRAVPKDHGPGSGYSGAMAFGAGDGSGNRGLAKGSLHRDVSQAVVDPLRSASSLNYSPALVQSGHRAVSHSPHSYNGGPGYPTHSPNLGQQKSPSDPRYLAVPSMVHSSLGRSSHGNSRDQVLASHSAPPFAPPEPVTSRSINSYHSHIPRQLSPVREVPSTGPPSSAGSPEIPQQAYRPGHLSYLTESDGASEVSIRTYSKLVPPPLATRNSTPGSQSTEALPDHSPTLPKSMHACSIYSYYSSPRSSGEHSPRLTHQSSSNSNHKPSNLLVKRRGEKVAGKMGNEFTLPAKLQRPIQIEHDRIHDDDDSTASTTPRSSKQILPTHNNTAEPEPTSPTGHKMTPSKRGADMYLNID
ncbi:uncharacterized protein GIQ15_00271 [Arthroderma uncinatum]|uniref:uncharacterized protein n=1 Tax=Arthroderma uncinatum TaxID=74035 RepID=UPI00144A7772|nr:uncharacterized protein GIQ15_00271 [Arthroderma uncinatum]KAF3490754.1 hypothetical protein GIQ15_00271 [Arthroderma uncinatum]